MGLQGLLSRSVWVGMALLALPVLAILQWDAGQQAKRLEEVRARGELHRLMESLQARSLEVSGALKSWANWTELYNHLKKPDPRFSRTELNARALAVADVDLLTLLDANGNVVEMVEVPGPGGELPATEQARQNPQVYSAYFKLAQRNQGCGAIQAHEQLALVCFSPVLDSEGKGESRGYVLMGRWLDAPMVEDVSRKTGVTFRVVPRTKAAVAAVPDGQSGAMFRPQEPGLQSSSQQLELSYPIYSLFDRPIADVRMTWPRSQGLTSSRSTLIAQALVVLLMLLGAVLLARRLERIVAREDQADKNGG